MELYIQELYGMIVEHMFCLEPEDEKVPDLRERIKQEYLKSHSIEEYEAALKELRGPGLRGHEGSTNA